MKDIGILCGVSNVYVEYVDSDGTVEMVEKQELRFTWTFLWEYGKHVDYKRVILNLFQ